MDTQQIRRPKPHVLKVRVTDEEKAWLERYAAADDRSVHYITRQALLEFYKNHVGEVS